MNSSDRSAVGSRLIAASWIVACLPLLAIAIVVAASIYIRVRFGQWPAMRDTVEAPLASAAIDASFFAAVGLLGLPLLAIVTGFARWQANVKIAGAWLGVFVLGWLLALGYVRWDPYGFVSWVFD